MVRRGFAFGACAVVAVGAGATAATAIRLLTTAPKTSTLYAALQKFGDGVASLSGGAMTVAVAAPDAGANGTLVDALSSGNAPMGLVPTHDLLAYEKRLGAFDLPFFGGEVGALAKAAQGDAGQALFAKLPVTAGVRVVGILSGAPSNLVTTQRAVNTPSEMRGLRIGVAPGDSGAFVQTFGALPVELAPAQLPQGLESGAIDGALVSPDEIASLSGVAKYATMLHAGTPPYEILAAQRWWESLAQDQRPVIVRSVADATTYQLAALAKSVESAYAAAQGRGMTLISPELSPFRSAGEGANLSAWDKEYGTALIDAIRQAIAGSS